MGDCAVSAVGGAGAGDVESEGCGEGEGEVADVLVASACGSCGAVVDVEVAPSADGSVCSLSAMLQPARSKFTEWPRSHVASGACSKDDNQPSHPCQLYC